MKLGIAVVYLVGADDQGMLDLHWRQIEKCTTVPYTIYASANRLLPQFRSRLVQHPHIKIIPCPETELRGADEHSFYLERLAQAAIEDGATHIATLHVDSFPIRAGWAEAFAAQLSERRPLATISLGPYTACLFFQRDFYLNHQPHFLLSKTERTSTAYKNFSARQRHIPHSGYGYLYCAHAAGLSWVALPESNTGLAHGVVYGDSIFHLGGNAPRGSDLSRRTHPLFAQISPVLRIRHPLLRNILPPAVRQYLWAHWGNALDNVDQSKLALAKEQILFDPDAYFQKILQNDSAK